jgi:hypothetical protein
MSKLRSVAILATASIFALTVHSLASAEKGEEHWMVLSKTAMSITGDISLSPTRLTVDHHDFPLRVAADLPRYGSFSGKVPARVLKVTRKMDPALLNGNRLGCRGPIEWIVVYRLDHGTTLGMDVFDGPKAPTTDADPGMCGTYTYARPD